MKLELIPASWIFIASLHGHVDEGKDANMAIHAHVVICMWRAAALYSLMPPTTQLEPHFLFS